jgi:hypothetical protein
MDSEEKNIPGSSSVSSEDEDELNSSIEALNWSDIEEELDDSDFSSFLPSLENSQTQDEPSTPSNVDVAEDPTPPESTNTNATNHSNSATAPSTDVNDTYSLQIPTVTVVEAARDEPDLNDEAEDTDVADDPDQDQENENEGNLEVEGERREGEFGIGDHTSNAPVLDDGVRLS